MASPLAGFIFIDEYRRKPGRAVGAESRNGDKAKVCMATNKWDRQCARKPGARMLMKELIPEGTPAFQRHSFYALPAFNDSAAIFIKKF